MPTTQAPTAPTETTETYTISQAATEALLCALKNIPEMLVDEGNTKSDIVVSVVKKMTDTFQNKLTELEFLRLRNILWPLDELCREERKKAEKAKREEEIRRQQQQPLINVNGDAVVDKTVNHTT